MGEELHLGRKCISFSLYGSNRKYYKGIDAVIRSARRFYPDWELRFYVGKSVPAEVRNLLDRRMVTQIDMAGPETVQAMLWRVAAGFDARYELVIFRDVDSKLSAREAEAVSEWVRQGTALHIIRDHPFHSSDLMGGLWGVRPAEVYRLRHEFENLRIEDEYGRDQDALKRLFYDSLFPNVTIHASFHRHEQPPILLTFRGSRIASFCGESFTSPLAERIYARLVRLLASRTCKCESKE